MTKNDLAIILKQHSLWLHYSVSGNIADLRGANLQDANLQDANLRGADLCNSKLKIFQSDLWTAYIQPDTITIGCQAHKVSLWKTFDDTRISQMHPEAIKWWNEHKEIVFKIHESL